MIELQKIMSDLTTQHNIGFGKQLLDGHMGVPIFRAKRNDKQIVVKIGFGDPPLSKK